MARFIIFISSIASVAAFAFTGTSVQHRQVVNPQSRCVVKMGGGEGYATTLQGKKERVSAIKELLDKSKMIYSVPASSLTVKQVQNLRRSLPEGTTVSVVKNKIMARSLEGTEYEAGAGSSLLKGANMWFFIEEDIGASIKAFNAFVKESNKKETHFPLGGVIDGQLLDSAGVDAVSKLPSKKELYAQIAGRIKAVPTKLARVIKEPNAKLARAIKLATEKNNE